jgi:hypothetical protein
MDAHLSICVSGHKSKGAPAVTTSIKEQHLVTT